MFVLIATKLAIGLAALLVVVRLLGKKINVRNYPV